MIVTKLLTELAEAGAGLQRLPGDRIEVVGDIPPGLRNRLSKAKADLLATLPDPSARFDSLWRDAIAEANAWIPNTWFGTAEEWAEFDTIEERFLNAKAAGNLNTGRLAATEYVAQAKAVHLTEAAFNQ